MTKISFILASVLTFFPQLPAAAQPVERPNGRAQSQAICSAADASIRITVTERHPLGEASEARDRSASEGLGWQLSPSMRGLTSSLEWLQAKGAQARQIVSFLPDRVWLSNRCVYRLKKDGENYAFADGEPWFEYEPDRPASSAELLSAGETADHKPVYIVLKVADHGSLLKVCRGSQNASCSPFAKSGRKILSIRYLKSPDTLTGELGLVQAAPGGKLSLVGVRIDAGKLKRPI